MKRIQKFENTSKQKAIKRNIRKFYNHEKFYQNMQATDNIAYREKFIALCDNAFVLENQAAISTEKNTDKINQKVGGDKDRTRN